MAMFISFQLAFFFTLHTYQMEFFAISSFAILEEITSGLGNNDFDEARKKGKVPLGLIYGPYFGNIKQTTE